MDVIARAEVLKGFTYSCVVVSKVDEIYPQFGKLCGGKLTM